MYQLASIVLPVAISVALVSGCDRSSTEKQISTAVKPVVVKLAEPATVSEMQTYEFPAKIEAFRTIDLAFEVSGKVQMIDLSEGNNFSKGDLLVSLNPDAFQRRVKQSQLQLKEAKVELDRISTLDKKGYISHQKLTQAQTNYELAKIALANSRADLAYSKLQAPFDGVVSKRFTEKNSFVAPGVKVAELQDLSKIYFAVDMPEKLVVGLSKDMVYQASVQLPGLQNQIMEVRYSEHENVPNPITQTYRVYFSMPKINGVKTTVGSVAILTLSVANAQNANTLVVPFSAIVAGPDTTFYVWRLDAESSTVARQTVTLGLIQGEYAQVVSGLNKGDKIVSAGVSKMRDGLLVKAYQGVQ